MKKEKEIIGRLEFVDLTVWDISQIVAKIDTGAFSSSLHCHNIEEFLKEDEKWVKFNLLDPDHPSYNERLFSYEKRLGEYWPLKILKTSSIRKYDALHFVCSVTVLTVKEKGKEWY